MGRSGAGLLLLLLATGCASRAGPDAAAPWPSGACAAEGGAESLPERVRVPPQLRGGGKLAFYASRDFRSITAPDGELYTLDLASGRITRLTRNSVNDHLPIWSPDGRSLTFVSTRDHRVDPQAVRSAWEIYRMPAHGGEAVRLTANDVVDVARSHSPDGSRVLFSSARAGRRHLFVMDTVGREVAQLTRGESSDNHPYWSRDGRWIAFTSTRAMTDSAVRAFPQPGNVFLATPDLRQVRQLTQDGVSSVPAPAPHGGRIAFTSGRDGRRAHLFLMELDGSGVRQLTRGDWHDDGASWSPDGRWISFETNREAERRWSIWVVPAAGGEPFPLLSHPCWRIFAGNWGR